MNTRKLLVIGVVGVFLLSGGYLFLTDSGSSTPPFEINNSTPTTQEPVTVLDGVSDGELLPKAANLHTIALSQDSAEITLQKSKQDSTVTHQTTFTPNIVQIQTLQSGTVRTESIHTSRFTATRTHASETTTTKLSTSTSTTGDHLYEDTLKTIISSISFTSSESTYQNTTQYFKFTGTTLEDESALANELDVDSVEQITNAEISVSEDNVIRQVSISVIAQDNNRQQRVSLNYSVDMNNSLTVQRPEWVETALASNAGITTHSFSNSHLVLQHKYGTTVPEGAKLIIQTPTGEEYTAEFTESLSTGDRAIIALQNNEYVVHINPSENPDSGSFLTETGRYIVTVQTNQSGIVSVTSVTK